jgi:predicted permease
MSTPSWANWRRTKTCRATCCDAGDAERIAGIVFPIYAVASRWGYAYGRWKKPDMAFANQLNMDVFVPALVFAALASKSFDLASYLPLAARRHRSWCSARALLAWPLARLLGVPAKTFVPPMMFKNSGNMGLPLMVLAFGEAALPAAVVLFFVENPCTTRWAPGCSTTARGCGTCGACR